MIKSYVIDTNILIQAPYACQCFEENRVILPLVVLEELDGLKKAEGEKGANARRAIRFLEKLRMKGDLLKGVELENGGFLRVEANCVGVELPESLPEDKADNRILKVCKGISDEEKPVVLVTKDLVLRIKAQIMGIEAQDFSTEQVIAEEEQYSGRQQCFVAEDKFKDFKKKGVSVKELYLSDEMGNKIQPELVENEFIILKADQSLKKTHLGRVEGKKVVPLKYKKNLPYGVKPRNSGQYFLQEALMKPADEAPLVIVKGMAGTAKITYKSIKKIPEVNAYIEQGNRVLGILGYTEHSRGHAVKVAETAGDILEKLGYNEHTVELAQIAGYMHDMGNCVNRVDHAHSSALMAFQLLREWKVPDEDIAAIVSAIGQHDEKTGTAVDAVSAALILADKTDVRRNRVRNPIKETFDIHDRVNYAAVASSLQVNVEKKVILLEIELDEEICSILDYFEIFLQRMLMCKRAAEILGLKFKMKANGNKIC